MLIIVDKKIPREAKDKLSASGTILELETEGIVYPAISGHPDIFICQIPQKLVISPSLPENYIAKIRQQNIPFIIGNPTSPIPYPESRIQHPISSIQHPASSIRYPASVRYNAAVNEHYLVHRLEFTDPIILQNCHTQKKVPVKQAYTRCNLLLLKDNHYLTSDQGIHKNLQQAGLNGIFVSPAGIILAEFPNGFIGGAMGVINDAVYITGSLSYYPGGDIVRKFLEDLKYRIVELYQGPLYDGGGILFMNYTPT
jgi:hypothetical protein